MRLYSGHFEITKADTVIEYLEMLFEIIVLGGICAPIAEELTVRGLLMGYIEKKEYYLCHHCYISIIRFSPFV